jgi:cytochrome c556
MRIYALIITFLLSLVVSGCGPSKAEREAEQRTRLELEMRAERERAAANKAITDMSKKLGRKPPALDLGVPPDPKPETKSEPQP